MASNLLESFRQDHDPVKLLRSVASYFSKHLQLPCSVLEQSVRDIANELQSSPVADDDQPIVLGKTTGPQTSPITILYGDLRSGISDMINDLSTDPEVKVNVGLLIENRRLSEVLQRLTESTNISGAASDVCMAFQDFISGSTTDILASIKNRLDISDIVPNVKQSILDVCSNVLSKWGSVDITNIGGLLTQVFTRLGFNSDVQPEPLGTFEGVDPLTAVMSDLWDGLSDLVTSFTDTLANVFKAIGYGIYKAATFLIEGYGTVAASIYHFFRQDKKSIGNTGKGTGHLFIDYSYSYPQSLGSWQLVSLKNGLTKVASGALTFDTMFGSAVVVDDGNGGCTLRFTPKIVNYQVVRALIYNTFNLSTLPILPIVNSNGYISISSETAPGSITASESLWCQFFDTLGSRQDALLNIPAYYGDCDILEGVYWSQWLFCVYASVVLAKLRNPSASTYAVNLTNIRSGLFNRWDYINGNSDPFVPSNKHFGVLGASMQAGSSAWAGSTINSNSTNTWELRANEGSAALIDACAQLCQSAIYESSVSEGVGFFLPYVDGVYNDPYTYYVQTDAEAQAFVKGVLAVSAIATVIVITTITVAVVMKKARMAAFAAEASAGSLSWDAAASGNKQMMAQAFKRQRKADFLNNLFNGSGIPAASKATSLNNDVTLKDVGKLIDPNF